MQMVDRDGNVHDIPDDQAHAAYASGQLAFPKGARVPLRDDSGAVYTVDEADLAPALQRGLTIAPPKALQQAQAQKAERDKLEGIGGQAEALGYGVAKGLAGDTLANAGIMAASRAAGGDKAAEETRKHLAALEEANPGVTGVGQALGFGGAFLLPEARAAGVGGKALRAAEVLGAPMRGVGAVGGLAERAATQLVGETATTALGRVAQGAVKMGARGAAEGALLGADAAVGEALLGDEPVTGEKLAATAWHGLREGAVAGGLFGGALGGAGKLVGEGASAAWKGVRGAAERLVPEDMVALARKAFGEPAPGLAEALRDKWVKGASLASGADREALEALGPHSFATPEGRANVRLAIEGDAVRTDAARALRRDIDELHTLTRDLAEESMGETKVEHIRGQVARGTEKETVAAAHDFASGFSDALAEMRADEGAYGNRAFIKDAEKVLASTSKRMAEIVERGGADMNAELYAEMDGLKKRMGKWMRPGTMPSSADAAATNVFREQYLRLRSVLESDGLWGKMAETQRKVNAPFQQLIDADRAFQKEFMTEGPTDPRTMHMTRTTIADPSKIVGYTNDLVSPKNDLRSEVVQRWLKTRRDMAEAISKNYDLPASKREHLRKIVDGIDRFEKSYGTIEKQLTLANQLRALDQAGKSGFGFGALSGVALGGTALGPVGAAVGLGVGAANTGLEMLANPGKTVRQLAAAHRLATSLDTRVEGGIKGFIKRHTEAASARASRLASEGATTAGRVAVRTYDKLHAEREKQTAAMVKTAKAVQSYAANPAELDREVAQSLGSFGAVAPKTAQAYAETAKRAVAFLASKVPPGLAPRGLQPHLERPQVSDAARAKWERYVDAVKDPAGVVDDMARGRLSIEGAETLRNVYPSIYQDVQRKLTEQISDLRTRLPQRAKMELSILYGVPVDPSVSSEAIAAYQAAYQGTGTPANQPAQKPRHAPLAKLAEPVKTPVEKLAGA